MKESSFKPWDDKTYPFPRPEIAFKGFEKSSRIFPVGITSKGVIITGVDGTFLVPWARLLENFVASFDGGNNWQPAGELTIPEEIYPEETNGSKIARENREQVQKYKDNSQLVVRNVLVELIEENAQLKKDLELAVNTVENLIKRVQDLERGEGYCSIPIADGE